MPEVAVLAAGRTAFTGRSRAQAGRTDDQLAGLLLRSLTETAGISAPQAVDGVILGSCTGPGGNVGRRAALAAGFGLDCPGWSVDAQCGSGMLAVQQAVDRIRLDGGVIAAGGVESPSTAPERRIDGVAYRQAPMVPRGFPDPDLVHAAADLARARGITRQRQDALAERSHRLALEHADLLAAERLDGSGIADDGPRAVTARLLARFAPLVPEEAVGNGSQDEGALAGRPAAVERRSAPAQSRPGFGSVTPGNTARIADGAAALLLGPAPCGVDGQPARPHTLVRAGILTGGDPALPGTAPAGALRRLLRRTGVGLDRLGALEIVEAFSAQVLATLDDLELADGERIDPRVNTAGGALALGHPWGASGAAVLVRLHHRLLSYPPGTLGAASCAIGGGMAAAVLLQRSD